MDLTATWNADFIDAQYQLWKADPNKVSRDWRLFFEGFELANSLRREGTAVGDEDQMMRQSRVETLIYRYRDLGHLLACLDPLTACPTDHSLLNLAAFDLDPADLDREFYTTQFGSGHRSALRHIIQALRETYCHSIGVEFMHLQDPTERHWLIERMEPVRNRPNFDPPVKRQILTKLLQAALFEEFLNKKYVAVTRFSLEGADAVIPMIDALAEHAAARGCREIILGMAHRGRLNVQAHILRKPYEEIFSEFESCYNPDDLLGAGDVKYHNGYLADIQTAGNHPLRIFLVNNPSHLETVDPIAQGFTRARQDLQGDKERQRVWPLLIHGDAAFAGQGVVAETLNMSQLEGYRTGGTLHLVINNQIGYTTLPGDARSTRYSTDIAKMLMVPIFHVHGEDPEAALHVIRLAADYRMAFGKDVVIDLVCYRRYGHNEGDEPYFTQPQMYARIRERPPLHRLYADKLIEEGIESPQALEQLAEAINGQLDAAYESVHGSECPFPLPRFYENWQGFHGHYSHEALPTGADEKTLIALARQLNRVPEDFALNSKLARLLQKRLQTVENGEGIDWANAEALAWASLLQEGHPVRLSGQDSGRGTFSQRHSVLVDMQTGARFVPLNSLGPKQSPFCVYDSLLSEIGVLGFEYGYSLAQPRGLVLWEAQFGDFVNNAQAIIDLFIASGESKWQRLSGLVLLLPHGLEGLGPEHSSARPERFLQLCADDNLQVCNATTPAQYFHLLRRQVKSAFRKPLVIMTPKSLLRHPLAVSNLAEMTSGHFQEVLDDQAKIKAPQRVLLCSGKISYELLQRRQELKMSDIAIIRLEQLYPFPQTQLAKMIQKYPSAQGWIWVQEEPQNMGGWHFVQPRLEALIEKPLEYLGRPAAASPAPGFPHVYKQEQAAILAKAVGPPPKKDGQPSVS
ncbi:MAG: 2-oxoglutarate dehydrogenase E1 component [Desulfobacterales bacterium]|nr:MAG: 2-oxoglutarate dehydrogenase E1 component [Desulfobacterales bacterium]